LILSCFSDGVDPWATPDHDGEQTTWMLG
jgi:hypothetical protein